MKSHPAFCLTRGRKVVEFCCAEASTAVKTAYELGFVPKPARVRYALTARLAPLKEADATACNELFNVLPRTDTRHPGR